MVTSGGAAGTTCPTSMIPTCVFGMPDEVITTRVDVRPWAERKLASMRAHETQVGDLGPFLALPSTCSARRWAPSSSSAVGAADHRDDDIFAGLAASGR